MNCDHCLGDGSYWEDDALIACENCRGTGQVGTQTIKNNADREYEIHTAHMSAAKAYGSLSRCNRAKVGALLVSSDNRPLLSGYNGTSAGTDNCCEEEVVCERCLGTGENGEYFDSCPECQGTGKVLKTKPHVHHAERNLLGYANRYGIKTGGCYVYVTLSPCIECAKQMEIAGIKAVFYEEEYKISTEGIEYLKARGITVEQIKTKEG